MQFVLSYSGCLPTKHLEIDVWFASYFNANQAILISTNRFPEFIVPCRVRERQVLYKQTKTFAFQRVENEACAPYGLVLDHISRKNMNLIQICSIHYMGLVYGFNLFSQTAHKQIKEKWVEYTTHEPVSLENTNLIWCWRPSFFCLELESVQMSSLESESFSLHWHSIILLSAVRPHF